MDQYLFCKKRSMKLNVLVCRTKGCSHLREKDEGVVCRYSPLRERLAKRREKIKKGKERNDDCGGNS